MFWWTVRKLIKGFEGGVTGPSSIDDSVKELAKLGAPAVKPLASALMSENWYVRFGAVRALQKIRDGRAVQPLIAFMVRTDDSRLREAAAEALREISDSKAVEPLIRTLKNNDGRVRSNTVSILGAIRDSRAVEPLVAALSDGDVSVQEAAAEALGRIRDKRAVDALIRALTDSDWRGSRVRWAAAHVLGEIGDPKAVGALTAALRSTDSHLCAQAAEALVALEWHAADAEQRVLFCLAKGYWEALVTEGPAAVPYLIEYLGRDVPIQRSNAAKTLGLIGDPRAEAPLVAALFDKNELVRETVAGALGRFNSTRTVDALVAALRDADERVRSAAAHSLGQIKDVRALPPLLAGLLDGKVEGAADAIAEFGSVAVGPLRAVLMGPEGWRAVKAFEKMGDIGANELISALPHIGPFGRAIAAKALATTQEGGAIPALVGLLGDDAVTVREAAAEALRHLGWQPQNAEQRALNAVAARKYDEAVLEGTAAVEPLLAVLRERDDVQAVEAIGQLGDERAVDSVVRLLTKEYAFMRLAACQALGQIGSSRAADQLVVALMDDDESVKLAAAKALSRIREPRTTKALMIAAQTDSSAHVREAASEAVDNIAPSIEQLVAALRNENNSVIKETARRLKKLGPTAVELLIPVLESGDPRWQRNSASVLGQIGDPRAVDPLVRLLNGKISRALRTWATAALAKIGDPQAIEPLIAELTKYDMQEGQEAVDALGELKVEEAVEPLIRLLNPTYSESVRCRAAWALAKIGGARVGAPLVRFVREDSNCSKVTLMAIEHLVETSAASIASNDVRDLALLDGVTFFMPGERGPVRAVLNCSRVRRLALAEFHQRGMLLDSRFHR